MVHERIRRKKKKEHKGEMGKVAARTVGIVKNNSDREDPAGSCKHELKHGKTNTALIAYSRV